MSTLPTLEHVLMSTAGTGGRVGIVTLNRPKALNALFTPLMDDLTVALKHFQVQLICLVNSDFLHIQTPKVQNLLHVLLDKRRGAS